MDVSGDSVPSKVWTLQDLRMSSTNWSLEGDAALLGILENIHNTIITQTKITASKLEDLNTELCKASVSLKNVNNRFMGLSNTQFVESSVQEDDVEIITENLITKDTSIINPQSTPTKNKEVEEAERRELILQAVSRSCKKLEGLCERLHISPDSDSESDSEPEDTTQRIVLRPKDTYSETSLPYLIGSTKWQKKWHIGLQECSSESDSEDEGKLKPEDDGEFLSSEEESQVTERTRNERVADKKGQMSLSIPKKSPKDETVSSMTSTSTNNSLDTTDFEVAKINSNPKSPLDEENAASAENTTSIHNKKEVKKVPNASDFAAELARKLGGNIQPPSTIAGSKNDSGKPSANTSRDARKSMYNPVLNLPTKRITGNIFLDEPPPIEDNEPYSEDKDLFADFDDEEDTGLFSSKPLAKSATKSGLFGTKKSNYGGLFDDLPDEGEEDTDFKKTSKSSKNTSKLFDESDEDIKQTVKTKPKGAFDDSDDEFFASKQPPKKAEIKSTLADNANTKSKGLFDESSGEFSQGKGLFDDSADDLDASFEIKKKTDDIKNDRPKVASKKAGRGLFDDDTDDSDLFGGKIEERNIPSDKLGKEVNSKTTDQNKFVKKVSLFGDDDSDDDLFVSLKKKPTTEKQPSIFSEPIKRKVESKIEVEPIVSPIQTEPLFTEPIEDAEDLFASMRMPPKKSLEVKKDPVLPKTTTKEDIVEEIPKKPPGGVSMFGNNPNIMSGLNSMAASNFVKKRRDSSSSESDREIPKRDSEIKSADSTDDKLKHREETAKNDERDNNLNIDSIKKIKSSVFDAKSNDDIGNQNKSQGSSLFDDFANDTEDDLFGPVKNTSVPKVQNSSLFDNVPPPLDDEVPVSEPRNVNSLFDYDEDDDLFSTIRNITKTTKADAGGFLDTVTKTNEKSKKSASVGLFDDEPPDLDDAPDDPAKDEQNDTNMFDDYPYYKSVNVIKTDKKEENTTTVSNDGLKSDVKKPFDDISDDDDLFSTLSKSKLPVADSKTLSQPVGDFKMPFEVRTDPSMKVFMDLSVNKMDVSSSKLEDFGLQPESTLFSSGVEDKIKEFSPPDTGVSILSDDPDLTKDENIDLKSKLDNKATRNIGEVKPKIDKPKPEISHNKPKVESKPKVSTTKPKIDESNPKISTPKPKIDESNPKIHSKPHIDKPEISTTKPIIDKLKPEISKTKPTPDMSDSNPRVETPKPEISKPNPDIVKPQSGITEVNTETPLPEIDKTKPEFVKSKPEIIKAKPEAVKPTQDIEKTTPNIVKKKTEADKNETEANVSKPNIAIKKDKELSLHDTSKPKPDILTGKPKIGNQDKEKPLAKKMPDPSRLVAASSTSSLESDFSEQIKSKNVSELINQAETDTVKEDFKEVTNIVTSSSIGDIKATLSKKAKIFSDTTEEIDGGIFSSSKNIKSEDTSPTKTVGKLQNNFNINVKALIPGVSPKLVKEINEERNVTEHEAKGIDMNSSVSFEDEPNSLDSVLSNSLSKDRVKIQVKRRPPSRKARQESARKSTADILFSFDEADNIDSDFTASLPTSPIEVNKDITPSIDILSSSYGVGAKVEEKENLLADKSKIDSTKVEKTGVFDKGSGYLNFDEKLVKTEEKISKTSDKLLFKPKSSIAQASAKSKQKKAIGLFGENDDEDDLFTKLKPKSKSLFSDGSNEDLFLSSKPKEKKKIESVQSVKSQGAIKKIVSKAVFDDSDSDSALFGSKTDQKRKFKSDKRKQTDVGKRNKLFGESDSEDELFKPVAHVKQIGSSKNKSGSLFDDDDEGDIFKSKSSIAKKAPTSSGQRTQTKTQNVILSSAEVAQQDPLSAFRDLN